MTAVNATQLLDIWEQGQWQSPVRRALLLLQSTSDADEDCASLPIGERDRRLLALREWLFGMDMQCTVQCSQCGEKLEFTCRTADVQAQNINFDAAVENRHAVSHNGYSVQFRLPQSRDLLALETNAGTIDPHTVLLSQCLLEVKAGDRAAEIGQLPQAVIDRIVEAMEENDPQAVVRLDMTCPNCEHTWQSHFDIVNYLWTEIDAWAKNTLNEIHVLASTYGWGEQAILTMSAWRRRHYMSMIYQ